MSWNRLSNRNRMSTSVCKNTDQKAAVGGWQRTITTRSTHIETHKQEAAGWHLACACGNTHNQIWKFLCAVTGQEMFWMSMSCVTWSVIHPDAGLRSLPASALSICLDSWWCLVWEFQRHTTIHNSGEANGRNFPKRWARVTGKSTAICPFTETFTRLFINLHSTSMHCIWEKPFWPWLY